MEKQIIENAWKDRTLLNDDKTILAINDTIDNLDKGIVRVAQKNGDSWQVNQWVKQAILLYFSISNMKTMELSPFEFYDKIPLKHNFSALGVRAVPMASARYGSFLAKGVVLMPSYVNIGAFVDSETMVDTWATVGSCAQIGKRVHLSGGVGIGGVLEPVMANPVIIEDDCFIGSRSIIVEGVKVGKGAVIGANCTITSSSKIIDVTQSIPKEYKGEIPENSVVIPGSVKKQFPAGEYNVNCVLIIGKRKESTNMKTSLNDTLREFNISI
ncbi:MAG: 2,3,4,5-tetrahydropyridine-2,6-dicarboxylate N-succinyltransferase [Bacteroidales bacterium]|jgi:2,3,4,5-tetrahydropyridine-2-carboxylate N-succinyltransferase|nr:2,3,4,5-tetrahydropyridine-2,6-dicarboxylate N-succinyltransferase [Bacteroidales bacterium]